jgi:probable HAF family extracellular repeat protein
MKTTPIHPNTAHPLRATHLSSALRAPLGFLIHANHQSNFLAMTRLAVLTSALLAADTTQAGILYTVTDLGTLNGDASTGCAINASGQVAGYFHAEDGHHAVRWTGSTVTDLGIPFEAEQSYAYGINASGQVAGSFLSAGRAHAVRWTGTTPTELATLGGTYSYAYGINASGQVAGTASLSGNSLYHAVRWTGATPTDLGTIAGGLASDGYDINDSGQVAGGSMITDNTTWHAVRWTGTTITDLGTLGGTRSRGNGINASGQVAGFSYLPGDTVWHAVRWTGTSATDLGTLGGTRSVGYSINTYGEVTGMSFLAGDVIERAFLYTGGKMYDLEANLLPGSGVTDIRINNYGKCINDLGQIAATGTVNGEAHALLLSPRPDTDHDGIADIYETVTGIYVSPTDTGTNPTNPDTDDDGLTDGEEVKIYHTNPTKPDTDGDGFRDDYEIQTGHSPLVAADHPALVAEARTAIEFTFPSALGKTYRIEGSPDLTTWTTVEEGIPGNGGVIQRFYSTRNVPKRYFRVEEDAP